MESPIGMKKFLVILIAVLVAMFAVSCTVNIKKADPAVTELYVSGITETEYILGDSLNLTGATLTVVYDDGNIVKLNLETAVNEKQVTLTNLNMNVAGTQKVTVNYGGKSTTFTITVSEWNLLSVELDSVPYVTEYVVGKDVDFSGARIKLTYEGDKIVYRNVSSEMVQPYRNDVVGTEKIRLYSNGVEMDFDVRFVEKTATDVSIIYIDEGNNFVFIGQGNRYNTEGMTVGITYDNEQKPKFDAKNELSDSLFIQLDDTKASTVTAVAMYYPSDYKDTYTYIYYGDERVIVGEKVHPGKELATNSVIRGEETFSLPAVKSKSYGTVTSISSGENGSRVITVSTTEQYKMDTVNEELKKDSLIASNTYLGDSNGHAVYSNGGGIIDEVTVDTVVLRTAPTTSFTSRVAEKSFARMDIWEKPKPKNFEETTIDNMIEGDELDLSTGSVRVY